jgi:hypothetical protein
VRPLVLNANFFHGVSASVAWPLVGHGPPAGSLLPLTLGLVLLGLRHGKGKDPLFALTRPRPLRNMPHIAS